VSVLLVSQHEKHTRRIILTICGVCGCTIFFHIISQTASFSEKSYFISNMYFDFLYNFLPETFLILRRIERDIIINVYGSSCKVPVILLIFWKDLNVFDRFSKNTQIQNFMKIRPVGAELFRADGSTDGQTDTTELIVAFRNSGNVYGISSFKVTGRFVYRDTSRQFVVRQLP
jgi:hypothetical protein